MELLNTVKLIESSIRLLHLYRDTAKLLSALQILPYTPPAVELALQVLGGEEGNLKHLPYDVWHVNRLGREIDGPVANQLSLLANALPSARPSVFPETDNVLGHINARRFELMQDGTGSTHDWLELIRMSKRIGDMPGVVKAMIELGRIQTLDDAQKGMYCKAVLAVQWTWTVRTKWLRKLACVLWGI